MFATKACLFDRDVQSLSSLLWLRFSSHRSKFTENKMAGDEVSPHPYALILLSGAVHSSSSPNICILVSLSSNIPAKLYSPHTYQTSQPPPLKCPILSPKCNSFPLRAFQLPPRPLTLQPTSPHPPIIPAPTR